MNNTTVPIVLFTYVRPEHLLRTLASLRANQVPLIYAFSDGARTSHEEQAVKAVREILHAIDWCEIVIHKRDTNLGLGRSIIDGVNRTIARHDMIIAFEDDLICVPGTYQYLSAALNYYQHHPNVMSVTGWTHARVTPSHVENLPYFDGRAECLAWGTWARAWQGMDQDAQTKMELCQAQGIDIYRYGADLPTMARIEQQKNSWAVRFLYHHILNNGLCLRPPHSMVDHIGFGPLATNTTYTDSWLSQTLKACPPLPRNWPEPVEHSACAALWQKVYGGKPATGPSRILKRVKSSLRKIISKAAKQKNPT